MAFCDPQTGKMTLMSTPRIYDRVAIARNLDEQNLKAGDVATLVDFVPHPDGGEPGAVLEVFNALGESLRVVVVAANDIEPLRPDEVPAVRSLVSAT